MSLHLDSVRERLTTAFLGSRLIQAGSVSSTQDLARSEAAEGAPEGTVVVAEEQIAGRGRLGRSWVSPPGANLYVTLVLRPSPERMRALSMIAPLAVAEAVEETTALSPRIKWPNDLLLAGRKLAGVLIDTEISGQAPQYALVGVGLNVNLDVRAIPEIADIATSLRQQLGREISREEVLAAFLNRFEPLYVESERGTAVREAWRSRLDTLGRQIRVASGGLVEEGLAEDVDTDGSLILRRPDGSRVTLVAGEVTLRA
jgi:BirA family biotin operon repressor/biotin-[acetyl-CoA-carboxylase] ligase